MFKDKLYCIFLVIERKTKVQSKKCLFVSVLIKKLSERNAASLFRHPPSTMVLGVVSYIPFSLCKSQYLLTLKTVHFLLISNYNFRIKERSETILKKKTQKKMLKRNGRNWRRRKFFSWSDWDLGLLLLLLLLTIKKYTFVSNWMNKGKCIHKRTGWTWWTGIHPWLSACALINANCRRQSSEPNVAVSDIQETFQLFDKCLLCHSRTEKKIFKTRQDTSIEIIPKSVSLGFLFYSVAT